MLRAAYVRSAHTLRGAAGRGGLLEAAGASRHRSVRHLRTLLAVHDVSDLASLDLPWWTYRASAVVDAFLTGRRGARVLEYGSGASTVWLARRAGEVHTVEHDGGFAQVVRGLVADSPHVTVHTVPARRGVAVPVVASARKGYADADFSDYAAAADTVGGAFDLVVVDGRARVECLRRALPRLAPDGMVVLDNANRRRYRPALRLPGLEVTMLRGATPCLPYPTTTALLRPTRS